MTSQEFTIWLRGFTAAIEADELTSEWRIVIEQLAQVDNPTENTIQVQRDAHWTTTTTNDKTLLND